MDLYRLLVERLHDFAVFLTDPDGRFTSWHPGVEKLLGYREDEWVGQPGSIIFTPEDRAAGVPERELARALHEGQAPDIRWHLRKDGSRLYVEGTFVCLKDAGGSVLGLAKVMRDVTERKRTEDDLRRSERRQAVLLMLLAQQRESADPIFMMQTAAEAVCRYLHADRARFQRLSAANGLEFKAGWTSGRIPLLTRAIPPEWLGSRLVEQLRIGRTMGIADVRVDPLTAGSRLSELGIVAMVGAPILRKGEWLGGLMVNHSEPRMWTEEEVLLVREVADLTWDAVERATAEEARRAIEERHTLSLNAAGAIGTWDWDVARDIVYPSERFARMFSLNEEEVAAGVPLSRLAATVHPEDLPRVLSIIEEAVRSASSYVADYRVLQPDGSVRWLHALGHAYNDANGKPARFPGAAVDITGLKEMEQALRRSEEFNRRILESTRDCVKVLGLDATLISINAGGMGELGLEDCRFLLGTNWLDLWKETSYRRAAEAAIDRARNGLDGHFEGALETFRGEPRWWDVRVTPIRGADGKPETLLAISRNITERKLSEDALKTARDQAALILESITDGFLVLDAEWRFTYVNRAGEELMGLTREELLGRDHWELFAAALGTKLEDVYREVVRERRPLEVENYYEPWQRWFSIKASPTAEGGMSAFFRDVTAQKKADAELRRQWHLFDTVLSQTADHNFVFSLDGRFLYANRAVLSLLRLPLSEVRGKSFAELNYPDDLARRLNAQIQEIARTKQPLVDQTPFTGADGVIRDFEYIMVPVLSPEGEVEAVAGSTRDITDQKRSEERERERQAKLLDSARLESLGVMAGGIAHDFNNLLVGVLGNASLLMETASPADRPLASEIVLAAERAAELTKQMLAYSGKGHFAIELFDLNVLIQENLTLLRASLARNVSVDLEFGCVACLIQADRTQVQQVVMNLIINASEAVGDAPGRVSIRTSLVERAEPRFNAWLHAEVPAGSYAMLEVRDTGSGMTQETMRRIFDPFFTTKFTGRGLGLAAVLGIVRGHLGDIEVESEVGKGTAFRVYLAAARSMQAVRRQEGQSRAAVRAGGEAVLVVDDEDIVRRMASSALRTRGFRVIQAGNGQEALEVLRRHADVAVIILDLTMPVMTGEQALPLIRAEFPGIPIVLSSGFGESEILRRFSGADIAGVLQKPYTVAAIVSSVVGALRKAPG